MLQGQNRRRHQHGHLLAVGRGLERRSDRHFGLAEAHIAANQTIHRLIGLHVPLDGLRRGLLVGRILPHERGFQLLLQISIRRKGKSLAGLALGIEGDQFARDVLDGLLGRGLELLPGSAAQFVDFGRFAFAALVARNTVQGVHMHEQNIVIFINQLDGLVYLAVLVDLDQTAETPHAVIDMYHIIAHAELIQLCDGHLLVALDLAVDPIALVAVENLMVGIETKFQVVIDETLMQRDRQGVDLRLLTPRLVENVLQPFELRPVFRQDIGFITALSVGNDVVGQQFEILVELGLGSRAERDRRIGRPLLQAVAQFEQTHPGHVLQQHLPAHQMGVNLRRFLHLPQNLATQIVHAPQYVVGIEKPVSRLSCKCEQRNPIPGKTVQVRNDLHLVQPVGGKLTGNLESADRIHLFPEKVQPVRFALGKGKHVEDTATQRILSGFVNEIHLREPRIGQQLLQLSDRQPVADLHPHGFAPHRVGVGHPFGQSFRIGTDNPVFARSHFPTQSTQRRRPLHDTLRILRTVNDRTLVGARKKVNLFFVEQGIKVVEQVGRRIAVFRHEDVRTARSGDQGSGINRESPADHIAQKNGPPRRIVRTTHRAERLRSGDQLQDIRFISGTHIPPS